jgi:hypothetical protein
VLQITLPDGLAVKVIDWPWQAVVTGAIMLGVAGVCNTDTTTLLEVSDAQAVDCART